MVYLFLFGAPLEDLLGRRRFVAFYLAGGLAAELAHILICAGRPAGLVPLVGASGAISACLGGFVVLLSRTRINFQYVVFLIFRLWHGEFWLPAWLVISFWFLEDVSATVSSLAQEDAEGGVELSTLPRALPLEAPTIHLYESGTQLGPFTAGQVSEMRALGTVSDAALYWYQGLPEWRSIQEFAS